MFLYTCFDCANARPGEDDTKIASTTFKGSPITCPRCGDDTLEYRRPYKRNAGEIKGSRTMEVEEQSAERAKRRRSVSYAELNGGSDDEEDEKPKKKKANRSIDDEEYMPQQDFTPSMRYTPAANGAPTMRGANQIAALVQPMFEMKQTAPVKPKWGREDTGITMARHLSPNRYRTIGAHLWANWSLLQSPAPPLAMVAPMLRGSFYRQDKMRSLEWCHLIADSLGGKTEAANLVAASYAANTYMLAIESGLHGKTADLEVVAKCSHQYCAELIVYTITNRKGKPLTFEIDARNDCFPQSAYDPIVKQVRDHVG